MCVDKTLITINILNSNEHTYAAQSTRENYCSRNKLPTLVRINVCCTVCACRTDNLKKTAPAWNISLQAVSVQK